MASIWAPGNTEVELCFHLLSFLIKAKILLGIFGWQKDRNVQSSIKTKWRNMNSGKAGKPVLTVSCKVVDGTLRRHGRCPEAGAGRQASGGGAALCLAELLVSFSSEWLFIQLTSFSPFLREYGEVGEGLVEGGGNHNKIRTTKMGGSSRSLPAVLHTEEGQGPRRTLSLPRGRGVQAKSTACQEAAASPIGPRVRGASCAQREPTRPRRD